MRDLVIKLEFGDYVDRREVYQRMIDLGAALPTRNIQISHHRRPTTDEGLLMSIALEHYHNQLRESPSALAYLENRGIPVIGNLPLGYCPGDASRFSLLANRAQELFGPAWRNLAIETGLLWKNGSERMKGRLIGFELRDNHPQYLQGRTLIGAEPRYLNPPSLRRLMFGMDSLAEESSSIVLVEGMFDALPLIAAGVPTVAVMGDTFTELEEVVQRSAGRPIAVFTDSDTAGSKLALKAHEFFQERHVRSFRVTPKAPYKDPSEWIEKEGLGMTLEALGL